MKPLIALALLLAGCESERPPAPTAEESDRLDAADARLNEAARSDPNR